MRPRRITLKRLVATCKSCSETKPVEQFHYGGHNRSPYCLVCRPRLTDAVMVKIAAGRQRHYKANKDLLSRKARAWRETNFGRTLWMSAKTRARRDGVEFTLSVDDVYIPRFCPALGMELRMGVGKPTGSSATIDRIDPTKGYTPGNVVVVSHKANSIKSNASLSEMLAVVAFYLSLKD